MNSKNLQLPFTWNERQVLIQDRVWFVPERIVQETPFEFPGWSHPDFFGNDNPIHVEYCSGNGAWVAEKAVLNPSINWVAVEMKFERVKKIWAKVKKLQLNNLLIIHGEAHHVTKQFFGNEAISDVYINFPDPWPKNRHAKHRLIQHEFANELWRILKTDAALTFVTDDLPYSNWLIEVMKKNGKFDSYFPEPYYGIEWPGYGSSYFEELWRSKGKEIRYHRFLKNGSNKTIGKYSEA